MLCILSFETDVGCLDNFAYKYMHMNKHKIKMCIYNLRTFCLVSEQPFFSSRILKLLLNILVEFYGFVQYFAMNLNILTAPIPETIN